MQGEQLVHATLILRSTTRSSLLQLLRSCFSRYLCAAKISHERAPAKLKASESIAQAAVLVSRLPVWICGPCIFVVFLPDLSTSRASPARCSVFLIPLSASFSSFAVGTSAAPAFSLSQVVFAPVRLAERRRRAWAEMARPYLRCLDMLLRSA